MSLEFHSFFLCSGLKLNYEKTVAVWLGSMKGSNVKLCPSQKLTWSKNFNLLGITFNTDLKAMINQNYSSRITAIEKVLQSYKAIGQFIHEI